MSFDARSRERLEALGRQLPQKLPSPAPAAPTPQANPAPQGRHPLELERNPEQLFRELMRASADGTVPPHLIDRLRQLESGPKRSDLAGASNSPAGSPSGSSTAAEAIAPLQKNKASRRLAVPGPPGPRRVEGADAELYTSFQQLLLEDEELD
jgi:hypothetical protein